MIYLLDTNAFSDLMRAYPPIESQVVALSDQDLIMICPVVRGEILYGIVRLPEGKRRADLMSKGISYLRVFLARPFPRLREIITRT